MLMCYYRIYLLCVPFFMLTHIICNCVTFCNIIFSNFVPLQFLLFITPLLKTRASTYKKLGLARMGARKNFRREGAHKETEVTKDPHMENKPPPPSIRQKGSTKAPMVRTCILVTHNIFFINWIL